MSNTKRKILFLFFLSIFIIATPLILLYSAGFQLSNGFKIQKTGMLVIETEPSNAKIFLNGKKQQGLIDNFLNKKNSQIKSPAKIKNIKPGEYTIKLELDNYWSWEKKLTISPGQTTFIEDVVFFKNTSPVIINNKKFNDITLLQGQNKIIGLTNKSIVTHHINNNESFLATSTLISTSSKIIKVSPQKNNILTDNLVYDTTNNIIKFNLSEKIGKNSLNQKWINENEILFQINGGINKYNLNDQHIEKILVHEKISDFTYEDNRLFTISNNANKSALTVWNSENNKPYRTIYLPNSTYVFNEKHNDYFNIYDTSHNILYLINPFSHIKPLRETIPNVKKYQWVDGEKLIYATDFEIWIYDIKNFNKTLITRISDKLNNIIWHPNNNYIIYSTDTSINTIELDNREKRNITTLLNLDKIKDVQISKDGDELFFYGEDGESYGIYKLAIQ